MANHAPVVYATVDFERISPSVDRARYKAERLREELRDQIIAIQIQSEKVPGRVKYGVLKRVRLGVLDPDDISAGEFWLLARMWVTAVRLRREIGEVDAAREVRGRGGPEVDGTGEKSKTPA